MTSLKSWLNISNDSPFSLANIPFGIISTEANPKRRPAVAIGDQALDLEAFSNGGGFSGLKSLGAKTSVFQSTTLNQFAALGRPAHRQTREYLQDVLREDTPYAHLLRDNQDLRQTALIPLSKVKTHLPLDIGDYTDFFAGRNHAFNVGTLFRGPDNALQPNYSHLPVGYHGRASSIVVSGTPIRRPRGQVVLDPKASPQTPVFKPSQRLDIELEMAMFVCSENQLGDPVPVGSAEEHIFGFVLMNDWSARDIQTWEYIPLGPFNAKNFGTTISPWVVLADALEPFRSSGIENRTELQSYLRESRKDNVFNIDLEVDLITSKGNTTTISKINANFLMWSWPQMIAHHTIGGCNLRTGDLFGSGTISGDSPGTQGSILEQIQGGKVPLKLNGGEERKFLEDHDTVVIRGQAGQVGAFVGFGECVGTILPAHSS